MRQPDELKKNAPLLWAPGKGPDVWKLFCACVDGDLKAVSRLLKKDPALVRTHYGYRTPIYFAVRENRLAVAKYLLARGADPLRLAVNDSLLEICRDRGYVEMEQLLAANFSQTKGASTLGEPVAAAIRARDLEQVKALLDAAPELVHAGDQHSNQPIHWATMTRQLRLIDELLARGADLNAARFDGARPIQLTNGDYSFRGWRDVASDWPVSPADVLVHLRKRGAYVDINTAASIGDIERVKQLLKRDPSLANKVSEYVTYYIGAGAPLKNAAARGHLEIVKLLLKHGADPNLPEEGIAPHGHALYSAVYNRHHEIAELLLKHGAFPSPPVESSADALSIAMSNGDDRMVELLCSYGSARSVNLLAHYGDVKTAAAVFAANPSFADDPGAFANAAGNGHEAFMRLMLRYCPDLPQRAQFPGWLVGAKTSKLNEWLFSLGMDASQPDWLGITPLHQFARKGDLEKAKLFLKHGADVNARDEDIASTPLAWAAKFGQIDMVKLLLQSGAKTNLNDDPPWATPLAWATRRGQDKIVRLLKRHGAR